MKNNTYSKGKASVYRDFDLYKDSLKNNTTLFSVYVQQKVDSHNTKTKKKKTSVKTERWKINESQEKL